MNTFISLVHDDWRRMPLFVAALLFPALLALLLSLLLPARPFLASIPDLQPLAPQSAQQLEALFDSIGYSWPPQQQVVPALAITRIPADMAGLEVGRKKTLFLRALLPLVLAENARLSQERQWLACVASAGGDYRTVQLRLRGMAEEYGLDASLEPELLIASLLERVDVVPVALVLAQAANESGWGTSRFSREVNNLFGEWTYSSAHGVLPERRVEGANHYVRRFTDIRSSVRAYLRNINRNRAYAPLRELRAQLRSEGHEPDPLRLAEGLLRYSARGEEYVAEIKQMIRNNGLNELGPLRLVHSATAG
jgi:Bax protein